MSLPVKNGSNRCGSGPREIPWPRSVTRNRTRSGPSGAGLDGDRPAVGGELDRVDDQVREDVGDLGRVDLGRAQVGVDLERDLLVPAPRGTAAGRRRPADQAARARPARVRAVGPSWSALEQLEHPLDRRGQPLARAVDPVDPGPLGRRGGLALVIFQSSVRPRTTVTGVFSSWLATSMNFPLSRLASTSRALVSLSSREQPLLLGDQVVLLDRLADDRGQLVGVPGLGDVAGDVPLVDRVDHGLDVGVAGEQQAGGVGVDALGLLEEARRPTSPASAGRRGSRRRRRRLRAPRGPRRPARR